MNREPYTLPTLNIKVFERNYIYTGLGKYEFISKLKQLDKDKYLIDFRINNRIDNKNLFQWDYYYKADVVSKQFLNNLETLKDEDKLLQVYSYQFIVDGKVDKYNIKDVQIKFLANSSLNKKLVRF